jgi:hypothetical protein
MQVVVVSGVQPGLAVDTQTFCIPSEQYEAFSFCQTDGGERWKFQADEEELYSIVLEKHIPDHPI